MRRGGSPRRSVLVSMRWSAGDFVSVFVSIFVSTFGVKNGHGAKKGGYFPPKNEVMNKEKPRFYADFPRKTEVS